MNNNNNTIINPEAFVRYPGQGFDPMKTRVLGGLSAVMNDLQENQRHVPQSLLGEGYDESFELRRDELRAAALKNQRQLQNQIRQEQQRNLEAIRRHEEMQRQQQQYQQNSQVQQVPPMNGYNQPSNPANNYSYQQYEPWYPNPFSTPTSVPTPVQQQGDTPLMTAVFVQCMNSLIDEIAELKNIVKDILMSFSVSNSKEEIPVEAEAFFEGEYNDVTDEQPFLPGLEPTEEETMTVSEENISSGINEDGKPVHRVRKVKTPKMNLQRTKN